MELLDMLVKGAEDLGVSLDETACSRFMTYQKLLLEWNEKMNLTAITEEKEIIIKHFLDSISLLAYLDMKENTSLLDLGTGAGFPGLPLLIARPDFSLSLLDSLQKRLTFLQQVSQALELPSVSCLHGRAEDLGKDPLYRESFDICVSRAVAPFPILCEWCLPFVRVGGLFAAMKGPDVVKELSQTERAVEVLGGEIKSMKKVTLPFSDITHTIIFIKKLRQTPTQYPRKPGVAKKNPIK